MDDGGPTTASDPVPVRVVICDPDPSWPEAFRVVGRELRRLFGASAQRIDHIGSTSVAGLPAKDVIDVQVTVADPAMLDDADHPLRQALAHARFEHPADNDDRRKRFFYRRDSGSPWVNLHVRRSGCVSQQQALLLRDYLRTHPQARTRYGDEKRRLARRSWRSVDAYADAKGDVVWALLREADVWSWNGWQPGPSDA